MSAAEDRAFKVRENKLRRMAKRQGLELIKSRRRDPRAIDYGGYMLARENGEAVFGHARSGPRALHGAPIATLDEVEAYLTGDAS
jgi:hypothetical protein